MNDKKQGAGQIVPDKEKEHLDQYDDAIKSPMHELEDKRTTVNEALSDEDEE